MGRGGCREVLLRHLHDQPWRQVCTGREVDDGVEGIRAYIDIKPAFKAHGIRNDHLAHNVKTIV